jgi:solute carrier family 35 (UDP-xylose/UDP-N-acetylglucosamine transporter), member B4
MWNAGVTITFAQMAFIALQLLPSFVEHNATSTNPLSSPLRLKPRRVPLRHWALQVAIVITSALMNNRALAYRVPFTLQILFRSAGENPYLDRLS